MERLIDNSMYWKSADGDDLPDIDREVIALTTDGKVVFAHRPAESWDGKNLDTGEVTTYYPKRYDAGGWNQPDVKWWLDINASTVATMAVQQADALLRELNKEKEGETSHE